MYFFNVCCIQLMEMFETRMSNFLIYKFGISSFILLFVSFIYLQDVDSYFAHILLLIMVLLLLSNWHFILDNKIYRTYNIVISIVVTIYSLVGYIIFSSKNELLEWYLFITVLAVMFIPIIYFMIHYRRITNYMGYKKNIITFLIVSWLFSGILGFILGILAATYRDSILDKAIRTFCYILSSTPTFWIGILLLLVFSVQLKIFPIGLSAPIGKAAANVTVWDRIYHLILPALTLSIIGISSIALHTREKMIEVWNSEYALFARARGESTFAIVKNHGIRNILLPAVTLQFASISELFGGSVLAENVFSYAGLGSVTVAAGVKGDLPLLLGITMFTGAIVFIGNMIANLLYPVIDPRIKEAQHEK